MDDDNTRALIWRHVSTIGTCMMVTQSETGVQSRPMRGVIDRDANTIWFFTDKDSDKTLHAMDAGSCCLTFADVSSQTYVSLTGTLDVVEDRDLIARHWSEGAAVYFPQGAGDQSVVMLRFMPNYASYWDAPSNPVVLAIKFLQAKVTGERPELGTNESTWMS